MGMYSGALANGRVLQCVELLPGGFFLSTELPTLVFNDKVQCDQMSKAQIACPFPCIMIGNVEI